MMYTLGIETSCDETSVSVTKDKSILSNIVTSSVHLHSKFGGVVPEIASRFHLEYITPVLKESLRTANIGLNQIGLIAVTKEPGLIGSLLVGISMAKALSYSLSIPLIEVNHVIAHIYANIMHYDDIGFPLVGLIVSGGHTSIIWMDDIDKWKVLGETQDDAAGEAFDKVAKILELGYPGGPIIEERARLGDPHKISFPRSVIKKGSLDFSFSGIKTAVLYYVQKLVSHKSQVVSHKSEVTSQKSQVTSHKFKDCSLEPEVINDICGGFQEAVCDMVVDKALLACRKRRTATLVVGGGVSANKTLRAKLKEESEKWNINVYFPPIRLCLDNAAMVGGLGEALYRKGQN
ncbi:tRNA (adenosine(37)-N6)-threonylcarbamoyltransferase complex transferase subunit TsaD [Omnitrophica bacterium]|nr:tRNA (adenosine(37)-N6)-threonylcarbamoyltransferase complex transferase subunit TsaD [Candidatus Omnitrophota bacterium]